MLHQPIIQSVRNANALPKNLRNHLVTVERPQKSTYTAAFESPPTLPNLYTAQIHHRLSYSVVRLLHKNKIGEPMQNAYKVTVQRAVQNFQNLLNSCWRANVRPFCLILDLSLFAVAVRVFGIQYRFHHRHNCRCNDKIHQHRQFHLAQSRHKQHVCN